MYLSKFIFLCISNSSNSAFHQARGCSVGDLNDAQRPFRVLDPIHDQRTFFLSVGIVPGKIRVAMSPKMDMCPPKIFFNKINTIVQ